MPADATDIHQEGLRLPPVRLTTEVREVLVANSRTPGERGGDLDAQVGANVVGVRRLAELDGAPFAEVLAHGERRCRAVLDALPTGEWSALDVLDSTGPADDQQRPATIRCTVRVARDADGRTGIAFDFTGTDDQRAGNTNAVEAVTVSAVGFALRAVLDHTLPANAGVMVPVAVVAPPGSLVAARAPAAVGAGNVEVSQRVAEVCRLALAGVVPGRVAAADQGTMNNLLVGSDPDGPTGAWVYYETVAGGQGGRPPRPDRPGSAPIPGMSGVHTGMTNTRNTPVEALERGFGLRVRALRLWPSGGAGAAPGGDGVERELEMLEPATVSLITERRASQPWGLAGGEPGARGENWLLPHGEEANAIRLPDKVTLRVAAGDVIRMRTPGGGGWGRAEG
jgi:N-methylhydantoinase B/oxoprolinase/acetone carboxylase alpha subunit